MRRRPPTILLLLPLLAALAAAGGWALWLRPPALTVAPAILGPAVEAVYATGHVEPLHWARVGPALRGRVTAVLGGEGERVARGQPFARLDDSTARHLVQEAEARARFAAEDLARTRLLVSRDIAPRVQLERAESEARATRALADAAARRLEDYVVRAPDEGTVLRRDVEPGQIADPMDALFWVGEQSPLRVTAEVDEEDIARVRVGQAALLRADAFAGQVLPAEVAQITPMGDTVRKAYRVRLTLPEPTPLRIGMTVEANIVVRRTPDAVLVPLAALREGRVFVVEQDARVTPRAVEVGVRGAERAEIRRGLAVGEQVVAEAPPGGLRPGQRIRPIPAAAP